MHLCSPQQHRSALPLFSMLQRVCLISPLALLLRQAPTSPLPPPMPPLPLLALLAFKQLRQWDLMLCKLREWKMRHWKLTVRRMWSIRTPTVLQHTARPCLPLSATSLPQHAAARHLPTTSPPLAAATSLPLARH